MTTQGDQQQSEAFLAGQEAFNAGDYERAKLEFAQAIKKNIQDWDARLYLGTAQFKTGDLESASSTFRHVNQYCPLPEIRIKAMKAMEKIERQLSGGEEAGAISQVLVKPSIDTLRAAHATLRRPAEGHMAGQEISLEPQKLPLEDRARIEKPEKKTKPQPVAAPKPWQPEEPDAPRKPLIPTNVGLGIVAVALLGIVYWAVSGMLPDIYSGMFVKPSGSALIGSAPAGVQKEEINFIGPGGVGMNGVLLRTGSKHVVMINRATTGNIGDDWPMVEQIAKSGMSVFIYDYRGFGKSQGKPDTQGLLDDGLLAHDIMVGKLKYKYPDIVVYGRGVGAGVAAEIARRRASPAVILDAGYQNLMDVAKGRNALLSLYPANMLPARQYDNSAWMKDHGPALLLTGDDPMIPNAVTKQFYDGVAEPKKILQRDTDLMLKFLADNGVGY